MSASDQCCRRRRDLSLLETHSRSRERVRGQAAVRAGDEVARRAGESRGRTCAANVDDEDNPVQLEIAESSSLRMQTTATQPTTDITELTSAY
jgi:hypothetical protein